MLKCRSFGAEVRINTFKAKTGDFGTFEEMEDMERMGENGRFEENRKKCEIITDKRRFEENRRFFEI